MRNNFSLRLISKIMNYKKQNIHFSKLKIFIKAKYKIIIRITSKFFLIKETQKSNNHFKKIKKFMKNRI